MDTFISFSGEARETHAVQFMNFFNKYGLHCWYDYHELFLGDELKKSIIDNGINKVDYCILIINKTYLNRNWPCQEAILLYERFINKKDIVIFPILLDITKQDLKESKLNFLLNIKYQFLKTGEPIDKVAFQIINRIFHDFLSNFKLKSVSLALKYFGNLKLSSDINIYNSLKLLNNFDDNDYKNKTIILICIIELFEKNPFFKTVRQIAYMIYEKKDIGFDMYKTIESIFLICSSLFIE